MKKYILLIIAAGTLLFQSCDLDINNNPNSATSSSVTSDFVLPAAIASTGYNLAYYNSLAFFLTGYQVPGYGIAGFGSVYTYNFTSSEYTGLWTNVYANLRNYQYVINNGALNSKYLLYADIARIMKVYNYELLVDYFGNVPWTEGLQGSANLTPAYDDDAAVYQSLVEEIDDIIADIDTDLEQVGVSVYTVTNSSDPLFGGDMSLWKQFANNIKLRLLVRASGSSINSFVESAFNTFSDDGFLKVDALINPGYSSSGTENPSYVFFHSSVAGTITTAANYYIPSKYVLTFYNGTVLSDDVRATLVYKGYPTTTVSGQLGSDANPATPKYAWAGLEDGTGIFKSRTQGQPIFMASEIYFLLAEAALKGHELDGDAKTNFSQGILESFSYLRQDANGSYGDGVDPETDLEDYLSVNAGNYLADYEAATSDAERLEAIITQKYIAFNYIAGYEAWNEYRRTGYPVSGGFPSESVTAAKTFVSISSQSTRTDGLPVRMIYPQAEYNLNPNVPTLTNAFSDPVFWDLQ